MKTILSIAEVIICIIAVISMFTIPTFICLWIWFLTWIYIKLILISAIICLFSAFLLKHIGDMK